MEIELTCGYVTIIDDNDYVDVSKHHWYTHECGNSYYARGCINGKEVLLHRFLLKPKISENIDHIDGNGLNNIKSNLRIADKHFNGANRKKDKTHKGKPCASIYKGVTKNNGRWECSIRNQYNDVFLGCFTSEEDAGRAYDVAALKYFGKYARLNFPIEKQKK